MLGQPYFHHDIIRKMVVLMGTILNDIVIERTDSNNTLRDVIKVPLTFAPKEKMIARMEADPDIDRPMAVALPMISFEILDIYYDHERKLNSVGKIAVRHPTNKGSMKHQWNGVPYVFMFRAYIYIKNTVDGTKIVEQILPYFHPEFIPTVDLIPEMNIVHDIPIVLTSTKLQDNYEGDFKKRRAIIWSLDFALKGWMYGPIMTSKVIKFVNTSIYVPPKGVSIDDFELNSNTGPVAKILVQPGLTANGEPTSNVDLSVPVTDINSDDDYGFVTIITEDDDIPS